MGLPIFFDHADKTLSISNLAKTCGRISLRKNALTCLSTGLFLIVSYAVAGAQTATTTTLTVNPSSAANGAVFTMTAIVKAGATSLTGGTVTFRDTYGGVTQTLGTVQVQSANGAKGNAVLRQRAGGLGEHSIAATFNPPKTYLTSSATQSVSVTGFYPTTASLTSTGGRGAIR